MIAKGTQHDNGSKLADYLTKGKRGETAELWQLRGFAADDIKEAFRSVHVMAEATKAEQPFFHVQVRLPQGEQLTRQQWEQSADRIERMLGLKDQPRAIAFHIDKKTGEEHMHVAWSRIDAETMKAIPLPFYKDRLKKICRELEIEFGLTQVTSQRKSEIQYAPTRDEDEQARRLGVNVHEIRETIRACYDRSDCGKAFEAALAEEGLILAQGDRRDFLVFYSADGFLSLGKKLLDVTAAQVRKKLADIDRAQLPTEGQAREQMLTRDLAEVQDHIAAEQRRAATPDPAARIAELDRLIFGALLDKAIREPQHKDEITRLGWRLPEEFTDELNHRIALVHEAQAHNLDVAAIAKLIADRSLHAFKLDGAEFDRLVLINQNAPPLAFSRSYDQGRQHQHEIERLDPLIYGAALDSAARAPELVGAIQNLMWQMPHEFMTELNEDIAAISDTQARNLNFVGISKLIDERERLHLETALAPLAKFLADRSPKPETWDRDHFNQEWENAVIEAGIAHDPYEDQRQQPDLSEKVLAGAGAVAELAIQGMEMMADFLTGATPPPPPQIILSEILADIDALKRRNERNIPPQEDLFGKVLEAAEPVAELGMRSFEMLADFFGGGTAVTPERIQAAIDERKQLKREAAEERKIDIERFRTDLEYRRHVQETKPWQTPEQQQRDRENPAQAEERDRLR